MSEYDWQERALSAEAERDQLRDERDVYRDQALPEAAAIMNRLSTALVEAEAERDRLRAAVRKLAGVAGLGIEDEWMSYAFHEYGGRHGFTAGEQAAYQRALDVSADMGGSDWDATAGEKP